MLWNPAAERVTGVPQADALGRTPMQALGRPLEAGEGILGGSRLVPIRRGGEEVWLSLSEAVMTDPAGAVAGRIYAFRDISAERSVEQMKSDFVSTVSHELRTPLTSIYGFAETLLRQDVLFGEEERATFLRYIASESERLTAIVDRLLSVAQLDTGDMAVQLAETDVGAVVSEAVRSLEAADGPDGAPLRRRARRRAARGRGRPGQARPGARAPARQRGPLLARRRAPSPSPRAAATTPSRSASRTRGSGSRTPSRSGSSASSTAATRRPARSAPARRASASSSPRASSTAMGGRIWVDSDEGAARRFVLELRAAES